MEMNMIPPGPEMMAPGMAPGMPPGPPIPPGGAGPIPPMDGMNQGPLPAEGGIEGLMAALAGGGGAAGGLPPGLGGEEAALEELAMGEGEELAMDPVEHIRQAMKHLMLAMAQDDDDERGAGVTKGMGVLQGLLGGEQKKAKLIEQAGG